MIKKILAGLMLILVVFAAAAAMQPDEFIVTRTASMAAPASAVFPYVNDFRKWEAWSPWAKMDPNAKNTFSGPEAGEGAYFKWEGNKDVGVGNMTITESRPYEHIRIKLVFEKPFPGVSDTLFSFKEQDGQTAVTWTMTGKNNFIGKAISLVMNCDKMVGPQFEKGLASIKALAETPAA